MFRPSHILPTMTVEQAGEIERREMMERQRAQAENAARRAREESEMTREEREERDLAKARSWDEFKDDNPFGHGNSKLRLHQRRSFFFFRSHAEAIASIVV